MVPLFSEIPIGFSVYGAQFSISMGSRASILKGFGVEGFIDLLGSRVYLRVSLVAISGPRLRASFAKWSWRLVISV